MIFDRSMVKWIQNSGSHHAGGRFAYDKENEKKGRSFQKQSVFPHHAGSESDSARCGNGSFRELHEQE